MSGRHSIKFSTKYKINLTSEERRQLLEVWGRVSHDIPSHNENIMKKFFEAYPEYQKYFMVAVRCEASKLCEHPKVFRHWEYIIELLGYILKYFSENKRVDDTLSYIALFHKDMNLNINDFKKYSTVFIRYLSVHPEIYLSPMIEVAWIKLMNLISQILCDKMHKFQLMEMEQDDVGNSIILTPEEIKGWHKCFWRGKSRSYFDFALPRAFTYYNKEFWIQRKYFWLQQIYWFSKDKDDYAKKMLCEEKLSTNDDATIGSISTPDHSGKNRSMISFDTVVRKHAHRFEKILKDSKTSSSLLLQQNQMFDNNQKNVIPKHPENSNISLEKTILEGSIESPTYIEQPNNSSNLKQKTEVNEEARKRRRQNKTLQKLNSKLQNTY